MRRLFSVGLAAALALCVAGSASAATSIDLVFAGSGTSVTTIAFGVSVSVTMAIILTSDDGLTSGSTSITWDNAGTTAAAGTAEWVGVAVAFNMMTGNPTHWFRPDPTELPVLIENDLQIVNSFDGFIGFPNDPPNLPAGSYQIGTIIWHTTAFGSNTNISAGLNRFDSFHVGFPDGIDITDSVTFGFAAILIVPEPGTASLLGLGLIGLIMAGRRKRGRWRTL